jgi:hypothetical protein
VQGPEKIASRRAIFLLFQAAAGFAGSASVKGIICSGLRRLFAKWKGRKIAKNNTAATAIKGKILIDTVSQGIVSAGIYNYPLRRFLP